MSVVWEEPLRPHRKPFWEGWRRERVAGMVEWGMVGARMGLSELVTGMGRVLAARWVGFLGIRKRKGRLKSGGGGVEPERRSSRTEERTGAAMEEIARQ